MLRMNVKPLAIVVVALVFESGCEKPVVTGPNVTETTVPWMGLSSAVNQVIVCMHEGTGWLLNKSEVAVKKSGDVRPLAGDGEWAADYLISVRLGGETFETTAKDVPCDRDGIPSEASVERLRASVEEIKVKMKRLQH